MVDRAVRWQDYSSDITDSDLNQCSSFVFHEWRRELFSHTFEPIEITNKPDSSGGSHDLLVCPCGPDPTTSSRVSDGLVAAFLDIRKYIGVFYSFKAHASICEPSPPVNLDELLSHDSWKEALGCIVGSAYSRSLKLIEDMWPNYILWFRQGFLRIINPSELPVSRVVFESKWELISRDALVQSHDWLAHIFDVHEEDMRLPGIPIRKARLYCGRAIVRVGDTTESREDWMEMEFDPNVTGRVSRMKRRWGGAVMNY